MSSIDRARDAGGGRRADGARGLRADAARSLGEDHAHDPREDRARIAILDLLAARDPASSICPSEAARACDPDDWRPWMDTVRAAAADLVGEGRVTVTQGEDTVDLATARGLIRLRRGERFDG